MNGYNENIINMCNENNENKIVKYEDIVTTGFMEPVVDTGLDYAEMGIDAFIENDIVKEIPVIKTIVSMVKVGLSIKEWNFAKKFLKFLERYHCGKLTQKEIDAFLLKYQTDSKYKEKIVTLLVTANDKYFEAKQSEIAGNLFVAYVKGLIEWEDYEILCGCIDRLSPFSISMLDELENEKEPYHKEYQNGGDPRAAALQACAFGYQWGSHYFTTTIGIIAHQYGIKADYSRTVDEIFESTWLKKNKSSE